MNSSDFKEADAIAAQYDESARKYGWFAPEVLFGLMHEFLEPEHSMLDLGIGTGLSAIPFHKAGLKVSGMDGSRKMLDRSASKGITAGLKQHDIRSAPFPYADRSFDHVVASGVFHLLAHLDEIFAEAARLIRIGGTFAFTIEELKPDRLEGERVNDGGVLAIKNEKSGVVSYLHSDDLVDNLLRKNGLTTSKSLDFVAYRKTDWADERTFRAYVSVKKKAP